MLVALYHPGVSPAPEQAAAKASENRIRRSWRRLTGAKPVPDEDRPTLIACSGGADSCALAIALASTPAPITLGHVVHDLRPRPEAQADRDAVRSLGQRLSREVLIAEIRVSELAGNAEANAREARYRALRELAASCGARWIVTAHHADDVLETMLMRLLRGSGTRGLGAIAPTLDTSSAPSVIRPCLDATHAELEGVCRSAGWEWREDATNTDESRFRAALRARVMPELRRLAPEGARRASISSALLRDAQHVIAQRASGLLEGAEINAAARVWSRAALRAETGAVLGEMVLLALGNRGLSPETLRDLVHAIRDESTDPRRFELGRSTMYVRAREVRLEISDE